MIPYPVKSKHFERSRVYAHDSDARFEAEKRDKELWQTMYLSEVLDDVFHPRPNQHSTAKQTPREHDNAHQTELRTLSDSNEKHDRFFGPHPESTSSCATDATEKHDYFPSQQHADNSSIIEDVADAVGNAIDAVSDIFSGPD